MHHFLLLLNDFFFNSSELDIKTQRQFLNFLFFATEMVSSNLKILITFHQHMLNSLYKFPLSLCSAEVPGTPEKEWK